MGEFDAFQEDVGVGLLHPGQDLLEDLTAGEEDKLVGGHFSISTDESHVTEALQTSEGLEGLADVKVKLRV